MWMLPMIVSRHVFASNDERRCIACAGVPCGRGLGAGLRPGRRAACSTQHVPRHNGALSAWLWQRVTWTPPRTCWRPGQARCIFITVLTALGGLKLGLFQRFQRLVAKPSGNAYGARCRSPKECAWAGCQAPAGHEKTHAAWRLGMLLAHCRALSKVCLTAGRKGMHILAVGNAADAPAGPQKLFAHLRAVGKCLRIGGRKAANVLAGKGCVTCRPHDTVPGCWTGRQLTRGLAPETVWF